MKWENFCFILFLLKIEHSHGENSEKLENEPFIVIIACFSSREKNLKREAIWRASLDNIASTQHIIINKKV